MMLHRRRRKKKRNSLKWRWNLLLVINSIKTGNFATVIYGVAVKYLHLSFKAVVICVFL